MPTELQTSEAKVLPQGDARVLGQVRMCVMQTNHKLKVHPSSGRVIGWLRKTLLHHVRPQERLRTVYGMPTLMSGFDVGMVA